MPDETGTTSVELTADEKVTLVRLARESVEFGVDHGQVMEVDVGDYSPALQVNRATFVTLRLFGDLVGCIGTIEPHRALVADVVENAYAAAFRDSRSNGVARVMLPNLDLHISLLSPMTPMEVVSNDDLLAQLRPGIDGLLISDGASRATFLPSVWEMIPDPAEFVRQLKRKAGLPDEHWSTTFRAQRYTAESLH